MAKIYDVATGTELCSLKPTISNDYTKNRATFDSSDDLVLNDGVLFDLRMRREIRKLDKLNTTLNGVFHPNNLEIISNSEVWDIRTFHLLKTVNGLENCTVRKTISFGVTWLLFSHITEIDLLRAFNSTRGYLILIRVECSLKIPFLSTMNLIWSVFESYAICLPKNDLQI